MSSKFREKVLNFVSKVPKGKVTTYKTVAESTDKPKAFRSVGNILSKNPKPVKIPCHRVVKSDGSLGGYVKGRETKRELLEKEGIEIENGKIDLEKYGWKPAKSD